MLSLLHSTLVFRHTLRMADADSVLEAAEFASILPEKARIISLPRWYPDIVALHIYAMGRLSGHEYSLVPLAARQFLWMVRISLKTRLQMILAWFFEFVK